MKKTHYKSITLTTGLISLMLLCILLIALATSLVKGNEIYAKFVGLLIIISFSCLSLNTAATILDKPKESIPSKYKKLVLGIIISTGVVVVLWLIVLFATDIGLVVRYSVGKQFKFTNGDEASKAAALVEATDMANKIKGHLFVIQLATCVTMLVAYFNLFVTRRFIFKNRMLPIQIAMYIGAALFYLWIFIFAISAYVKVNDATGHDYHRVIVTSNFGAIVSNLGLTLALSGLAVYLIAKLATIWSVRKFLNEGLDDNKATSSSNADTNNIKENSPKDRLEKLNELHSQGLISDEDYEKKKKDIIDSI